MAFGISTLQMHRRGFSISKILIGVLLIFELSKLHVLASDARLPDVSMMLMLFGYDIHVCLAVVHFGQRSRPARDSIVLAEILALSG